MESYDLPNIDRASENIAKLLAELLEESARIEKMTKGLRTRILADLTSLTDALPPEERGILLSRIATKAQKIFDAKGSPKVKISGGCVGRDGVGVRAEEGGSYAGVCVTGSLDEGVTGGGVEVGTSC